MSDLNLPIVKRDAPPADIVLSMEQYMEFVQFCWDNVVDREAVFELKKTSAVDVPFKL